ncbi:MAG: NifB/NifX family molybdenum-iron cluster-binding protein [Chloroflexota bacterium]|nr:NifB/NifX family molybdenum-iron cluster-binding protein [Chloroflexota bacterium]
MKIAISADGANLEAKVAQKFGISKYLVIIDLDSGDFEAVPNPGVSEQRGAGIQAVMVAISKDARTVLTGWCSPAVHHQLTTNGIEVISGLSGTVGELVEKYRKGDLQKQMQAEVEPSGRRSRIDRVTLLQAAKSSARQFASLLPILIGVVLLIGLFNAFVSKELLASILSGRPVLDTLWGACVGSILAGNPINSYVIGGELLKHGVSLFAVTALIITWVTVGLVQLPAEIAALGRKFALVRNATSFVLFTGVAVLTVVVFNLIMR